MKYLSSFVSWVIFFPTIRNADFFPRNCEKQYIHNIHRICMGAGIQDLGLERLQVITLTIMPPLSELRSLEKCAVEGH